MPSIGTLALFFKIKITIPGTALLFPLAWIPSELTGLTTEFGMGSGVALSLETPGIVISKKTLKSKF
jgi:hypothetical protein